MNKGKFGFNCGETCDPSWRLVALGPRESSNAGQESQAHGVEGKTRGVWNRGSLWRVEARKLGSYTKHITQLERGQEARNGPHRKSRLTKQITTVIRHREELNQTV